MNDGRGSGTTKSASGTRPRLPCRRGREGGKARLPHPNGPTGPSRPPIRKADAVTDLDIPRWRCSRCHRLLTPEGICPDRHCREYVKGK